MDDKKFRIEVLKDKLGRTDYMTLKYTEGQLTEGEWNVIKEQRQAWRLEIERLEKLIKEEEENGSQQ